MNKKELLGQLMNAIISGNSELANKLVKSSANEIDPLEVINQSMMPAMKTVGDNFGEGKIFFPEMLQSAETMKAAMKILKPILVDAGKSISKKGTVIMGTVKSDIHEIGKNIVASLMEVSGFEVHDVGFDCPAKKFVEKAQEVDADIIGLSAIMTTTMPYQKEFIEYLKARGLRDEYLVIVGGGVVTQEWADEIGADGYGELASDAVKVAENLLKK
jgi:corrinoid protein of di/trimethylamine methyltransferase